MFNPNSINMTELCKQGNFHGLNCTISRNNLSYQISVSIDAIALKGCALSVAVGAERMNIPFFFPVHWLNTQVGMNRTWLSVCVQCQTSGVARRASAWDLPLSQRSSAKMEIQAVLLYVLKLCYESQKSFLVHYRFSFVLPWDSLWSIMIASSRI